MSGRRRTARGLWPEERDLWQRVASSVRPIKGGKPTNRRVPAKGEPMSSSASPEAHAPATGFELEPFRIGARAAAMPPSPRLPEPSRVQIDRKVMSRLSRGKQAPEARIDLHGMTLAEAQPALTSFVLRAHSQGRRLVLVITGKGRGGNSDSLGSFGGRPGALRREVPLWLARAPLAAVVLAAVPAHLRHGGDGALYVWLRRRG